MHAHHRRGLAVLALAVAVAGCSAPDGTPSTTTAPTGADTTRPPTTAAPTTAAPATTAPPPPPPTTTAPPSTSPPPAAGPVRTGRATHYRLESLGNCSFPDYPGTDSMYVALNATDYGTADLCGAYLAVQGNRGSVTVKVIDQCPECPPGALDLSEQAFARVTGDAGISTVQWRVVSGPAQPGIAYRIKEGSSQWWAGILVLNHRNPIRRLEARVNGQWVALQREEYNYFLAPQGLGPGPFDVRVTDTFGEQVVSTGLLPQAGKVFPTGQQFAGH